MFRVRNLRGSIEARVSQVIVATRVVCYTEVRCPACGRRLFDLPGTPNFDLRIVDENASGEGLVIRCKRGSGCGRDIEVIEDG
jgi:hypothetical protein